MFSAGIVVYLMLGILWAQAYMLFAQVTPDTFRFPLSEHSESHMGGFNAFYFSFSTLTTVGFGDITPMSKIARTLAVMEAVTGPCIWRFLSPGLSAGTRLTPAPVSRKIPRSDEIRSIDELRIMTVRDLRIGDGRPLFLPIRGFIPSWRALCDWFMVRIQLRCIPT